MKAKALLAMTLLLSVNHIAFAEDCGASFFCYGNTNPQLSSPISDRNIVVNEAAASVSITLTPGRTVTPDQATQLQAPLRPVLQRAAARPPVRQVTTNRANSAPTRTMSCRVNTAHLAKANQIEMAARKLLRSNPAHARTMLNVAARLRNNALNCR